MRPVVQVPSSVQEATLFSWFGAYPMLMDDDMASSIPAFVISQLPYAKAQRL